MVEIQRNPVDAFLNASAASHNSGENSGRAVASELLCVTDAAVKAFGTDPKDVKERPKSPGQGPAFPITVNYKHPQLSPTVTMELDASQGSSEKPGDSPRSTTASDLLIRSTGGFGLLNPHTDLNLSNASQGSVTSGTSRRSVQSFLSDGAVQVKVPKKKLREIQPPPDMVFDRSSFNGTSSDVETGPGHLDLSKHKPAVIVERHQPPTVNQSRNERIEVRGRSDDSHNISHISQASVHHTGSESSCSQPEIVTVPDLIVTVHATDVGGVNGGAVQDHADTSQLSSHSHKSHNSSARSNMLQYKPPTLRQGAAADTSRSSGGSQKTDELQISQFSLTDKQKLLKDSFTKRQQNAGPVRRVIQPKFVGTKEAPAEKKAVQKEKMTDDSAVTAAAVAASAAVAATQPFLQAQQAVGAQMTAILERLAAVQEVTQQLTTKAPPTIDVPEDRVNQLQDQLSQVTHQRLNYLEQHSLNMQAQLLGVSREPRPDHARSYRLNQSTDSHHQMAPAGYYKRDAVMRSKVSQEELSGLSHMFPNKSVNITPPRARTSSSFATPEREPPTKDNALHTPAPREQAPVPMLRGDVMSRDANEPSANYKPMSGGFLAEILNREVTPQRGPFAPTPNVSYMSAGSAADVNKPHPASADIQNASHLVQELNSLKDQLTGALDDVNKKKLETSAISSGSVSGKPAWSIEHQKKMTEPAPLDTYMVRSTSMPPVSPYPVLNKHKAMLDSKKAPEYVEAEETLDKVQRACTMLETNLATLLRSKNEGEVYALIDNISKDSAAAERLRIKKMVDDLIGAMSKDVEQEIMEDMIREKEKKRKTFVQAERDLGQKVTQRGKVRAEAKVNTGLKKVKQEEPLARRAPEKASLIKKLKPKKQVPRDEEYMTRVYGKAAYQNRRTTQRDPYLRYQNQPTHKAARPPSVTTTKVSKMQSVKTQTSQQRVPPAGQAGMAPPEMLPIAIPLGAPRQMKTTVPASPASPVGLSADNIVSSTPVTARPPSPRRQPSPIRKEGSLVQIASGLSVEQSQLAPSPIAEPNKHSGAQPGLPTNLNPGPTKQPSLQLGPREARTSTVYEEELLPGGATRAENTSLSQHPLSDDEDVLEEEEQEVISLPGSSHPREGQYHGPAFPPKAPPIAPPQEPSSDVLAADIRRRDLVENKALDWVEQELMARILTEVNPLKQRVETVPYEPPPVTRQIDTSVLESDSEASFVAETIGQEGFQLFVDAGQPVDEKLVNSLMKEVILEKIRNTIGTKQTRDIRPQPVKPPLQRQGSLTPPPVSPPISRPPPVSHEVQTPLPTPEPTPRELTPEPEVAQPLYASQPPVYAADTPSVTPEPSQLEEEPVSVATEDVVETPAPQSEVIEAPQQFSPNYDIHTPCATPPKSPDVMSTPSVSVEEAPPREPTPVPQEEEEESIIEEPPQVASVAVATEPEKPKVMATQTSVAEEPDRSLSTPTPETTVSETIGENVSEGQWLVSRSEGQVLDMPMDMEVLNDQLHLRAQMDSTIIDDTLPEDTLRDPHDINDQDETGLRSEGEFSHHLFAGQADPGLLAVLAKMREPGLYQQPPLAVDQSMGEIPQPLLQPRELPAPSLQQQQQQRAADVPDSPGLIQVQPRLVQSQAPAPVLVKEAPPTPEPEEQPEAPPATKIEVRPRTSDPNRSGVGRRVPTPENGQRPSSGGRPMAGSIMATGNVPTRSHVKRYKPGGAGVGRPMSSQGAALSRSSERLVVHVDTSQESLQSVSLQQFDANQATRTMSDYDLRSMTPDQMNVEAIVQSGGYLTRTMSSQSDGLATNDFNQSGPLTGTLEGFGQSGHYTDSLEQTGDLGQTGNTLLGTGRGIHRSTPLALSVTIPSMAADSDDDSANISEVSYGGN